VPPGTRCGGELPLFRFPREVGLVLPAQHPVRLVHCFLLDPVREFAPTMDR
jgi:hypothetical protein